MNIIIDLFTNSMSFNFERSWMENFKHNWFGTVVYSQIIQIIDTGKLVCTKLLFVCLWKQYFEIIQNRQHKKVTNITSHYWFLIVVDGA